MHANITVTNAERPRFLSQYFSLIFHSPKARYCLSGFYLEQTVGPLGTVSTRGQLSFTQNPCVADKMKVCN